MLVIRAGVLAASFTLLFKIFGLVENIVNTGKLLGEKLDLSTAQGTASGGATGVIILAFMGVCIFAIHRALKFNDSIKHTNGTDTDPPKNGKREEIESSADQISAETTSDTSSTQRILTGYMDTEVLTIIPPLGIENESLELIIEKETRKVLGIYFQSRYCVISTLLTTPTRLEGTDIINYCRDLIASLMSHRRPTKEIDNLEGSEQARHTLSKRSSCRSDCTKFN
jgi:hypothetical protein